VLNGDALPQKATFSGSTPAAKTWNYKLLVPPSKHKNNSVYNKIIVTFVIIVVVNFSAIMQTVAIMLCILLTWLLRCAGKLIVKKTSSNRGKKSDYHTIRHECIAWAKFRGTQEFIARTLVDSGWMGRSVDRGKTSCRGYYSVVTLTTTPIIVRDYIHSDFQDEQSAYSSSAATQHKS